MIFAVENELATLPDFDLPTVKKEFIGVLKREALKQRMGELVFRIRQAETEGQSEQARELSGEFNNLTRELSKYHAQ